MKSLMLTGLIVGSYMYLKNDKNVQAADLSQLQEIANGQLIFVQAVKAKDLKGKVILLEYWGQLTPMRGWYATPVGKDALRQLSYTTKAGLLKHQ